MIKRLLPLFLTFLSLPACVQNIQYAGTASLAELQRLGTAPVAGAKTVQVSRIRFAALQETALTLGAQAGLAWRSKQINKELEQRSNDLDKTYNFYAMLLNKNVLPPVLSESDDSLNLDSPNSIRLSSKTYKIVNQARFVTAPPTWRDYLWMNFSKPDAPDKTLLPKNATEQMLWKHYVAAGWDNGIHQANNIMSENLSRINRDYQGMALYRKLYAQNMVSAPFVAKTELGITGDSSEMSINDQILRITALPQLNLKGNTWKPGVIPESHQENNGFYSAPPAKVKKHSHKSKVVIQNEN